MARKKKGRSRHGSGTIVDWVRNGKKVGRKGYVELERGPDGKRNRKVFYGKIDTEVQEKMDEFRGQLKMGVEVVTSSRQTLQQYLDWWLKDVAVLTIKPVTLDSYERKMRVHVYPKLGKVMLTDLKPTHLTTLYAGIIRSGLSKRTGQYVHAVIHKALQDAVSHRLIPYNVATNVKAPKPDKKEAAYIPPEKVTALCDAITGDWLAPLFYLALATGLRRGELCALKWEDIDWTRPALRVDETTQELPEAKGGVRYDAPKSQKSRRTVVLFQNAVEVLQAHRKAQAALRMKLGAAWLGGTFVFTTEKGTPLRPSTVSNHWRLIRKRAGVPEAKDVTLHGLRHTHATMLLQNGIQPKVVMERLGHSTISIGMDIYSHVIRSMQDEVADKLDTLMPRSRQHA